MNARHCTSLCKSRTPSPVHARTLLTPLARRRPIHGPGYAGISTRGRQGGFTLLEMVAAFVVFALAFGLLMQINTSALRTARHSATYTHATLLAKSMLDQAGVGAPLEEGVEQGEFEGTDFTWELSVQRTEPPAGEGGLVETIAVDLFRLELKVMWDEGGREREARFVTLRAMQPEVAA